MLCDSTGGYRSDSLASCHYFGIGMPQ